VTCSPPEAILPVLCTKRGGGGQVRSSSLFDDGEDGN